MYNTAKSIERLKYLCRIIPPLIKEIKEEQFAFIPAPGKWSKKQILGHLIDSATNNHQRFIRIQFENLPFIKYYQDDWNKYSYYNELDSLHLISFWKRYNEHLTELISRIAPESLNKECNTGGEKNVTLGWLIDDYVTHLEHHLKAIVQYV